MTKILLIEDDVQIQELVRFNLEKEGFAVYTASDGEQGLDLALKEKPDLIILDLTLPVIDGYDVCKILRAQKDTAAIPIIVLSARDDVADKVIGLELGADDYITKPFSSRELFARIKARLREEERKNVLSDGLDIHISHLRNKLKILGPVLEAVRGVGYHFARR